VFDPETINEDKVKEIVVAAGRIGLMDWRPKYGRFTVEFI
jgi:hypothetical protein